MQEEQTNALPIGSMLREYKIISILGKGGFGITYKVRDENGKFMAIKEYMLKGFATRSQNKKTLTCISNEKKTFKWGLDRFLNEVKLLNKLNHIHIVKVYKYFEANGTAYFVMDFFEGETLEKYLEKNRGKQFSKDEILYIMMPIVEALKAVHAEGFLHRDVAPDNIYLRDNDSSILIDFGASRNALGVHSQNISAIIKIGYSPVEQYTSKSKQNETTDLYAVSAVIYEMITGRKPPESTFRQTEIFDDKDDPIENIVENYKSKFPLSFLETVEQGLKIRQKDRIQTIKEFQEGLVKEDEAERDNNNALLVGYMLNEFEILSVLGNNETEIIYKVFDANLNKEMIIIEYMPDQPISHSGRNPFEFGLKRFIEDGNKLLNANIMNILKIIKINDTAYIIININAKKILTLRDYLEQNKKKKFTQDEINNILTPLIDELEIISNLSIIRPIYPENIFIDNIKIDIIFELLNVQELYDFVGWDRVINTESPYTCFDKNKNETIYIYTLSAIIYEMITGDKAPLFTHRQLAIFYEEPDPIEDIVANYQDRFSLSFLKTVNQGLEIRQKDRIQSIQEFQEGLVGDNNPPPPPNNLLKIIIGLLLVIIIGGGVFYYITIVQEKQKEAELAKIAQEKKKFKNITKIGNLMWEGDTNHKPVEKKWVTQVNFDANKYMNTSGDTATSYCSNLSLGGYSDWRLPTIDELKKVIVDCGGINTTLDDDDWDTITDKNKNNNHYQECYKSKGFTSYDYWSSTTYASYTSYAWFVDFYGGYTGYGYKSGNSSVRCVRAGQ